MSMDAASQATRANLILDYRAWANKYVIAAIDKTTPRPSDGVCTWLTETSDEQCVLTNGDKTTGPCEYFCVAIPQKPPKEDPGKL
jgi:hypothetical protein